jgi:hypothetical protein
MSYPLKTPRLAAAPPILPLIRQAPDKINVAASTARFMQCP